MEFKEPPQSLRQQRSAKWENIVLELMSHPREWAFVGTYTPAVAVLIRRGTYKAFIRKDDPRDPAVQMRQDWEVTTRKKDDQRHIDIYIRYIGG